MSRVELRIGSFRELHYLSVKLIIHTSTPPLRRRLSGSEPNTWRPPGYFLRNNLQMLPADSSAVASSELSLMTDGWYQRAPTPSRTEGQTVSYPSACSHRFGSEFRLRSHLVHLVHHLRRQSAVSVRLSRCTHPSFVSCPITTSDLCSLLRIRATSISSADSDSVSRSVGAASDSDAGFTFHSRFDAGSSDLGAFSDWLTHQISLTPQRHFPQTHQEEMNFVSASQSPETLTSSLVVLSRLTGFTEVLLTSLSNWIKRFKGISAKKNKTGANFTFFLLSRTSTTGENWRGFRVHLRFLLHNLERQGIGVLVPQTSVCSFCWTSFGIAAEISQGSIWTNQVWSLEFSPEPGV